MVMLEVMQKAIKTNQYGGYMVVELRIRKGKVLLRFEQL